MLLYKGDIEKFMVENDFNTVHNYNEFLIILREASKQTTSLKGKDRHGTKERWIDQPIMEIQRQQDSADFTLGQVIKKCLEVKKLDSLQAIEEELYGAIGYIAGAIQYYREKYGK